MRGVITGLKSHSSTFYFITGEDGKQYYSRPGFLAAKKAAGNRVWDKFVWNGNGCEFDPVPDEEGKSPVAMNVTPDFVADPNFGVRKANRLLRKQQHQLNVERKEANRIKEAMIRKEAAERRALRDLNKVYVIQEWKDGAWTDFRDMEGNTVMYKTVRDANNFMFCAKKQRPNHRFRYVKREWDGHGKEESN